MPRVVRSIRKCVILAAVATLSVSAATAQEPTPPPDSLRPSLELFGGWTRSSSDTVWSIRSQFTGSEGHSEVINGRSQWVSTPYTVVTDTTVRAYPPVGFDVGVNLFATSHIGVQVRYDYSRGRLQGPDWAYLITRWTGVTEQPSPALTGNASLTVVSLGPVVRGRFGRRIVWNISAGFSQVIFRSAYETSGFILPGYDSRPSRWTIKDRAKAPGVNAGAGILLALKGPFALALDYRYTGATERLFWNDTSNTAKLAHTRVMVGLHITPWRKKGVDIIDGWKAR